MALALLALAGFCAAVRARDGGNGEKHNFLELTGSADWELFRSDGLAGGRSSSFDAFRQRYGINLAGSIWDYRFNRFLLGLDLYRDERGVDGRSADSTSIGYRAESTFFPSRTFPLRLFARRSTIDSAGAALGDSDRETAAWGVEWNIISRSQRDARLQFGSTAYDLLSPIALQERRKNMSIELSQRSRRRETSIRCGFDDQKELVRDTRFTRQDYMVSDRTRFDSGIVLLLNGTHMLSDARFMTGERDDLTQSRLSATLDFPQTERAGFSIGYDFYDNSGEFVDSRSHSARGNLRVLLGNHWEAIASFSVGALQSATAAADISQDSAGATLGMRYNRQWSHLEVATAYTHGIRRTTYDVDPDRAVTNQGFDLHLRIPVWDTAALFGSATVRRNENDVTGVGFTYDETVARGGVEAGIGDKMRGQLTAYRRDTAYDTFQFGLQESTELGLEGTLSRDRGSLSLILSTREGISEFIPDPSSSGPFLPGIDLVSSADVMTAAAHWRFLRRLSLRLRANYEDREYASIGRETILAYQSEVDWSPGVWRLILSVTHYERNNSTSFEQDALLLKASRRFF